MKGRISKKDKIIGVLLYIGVVLLKTEEEVEAEINELFPINLEGIHDDERNEKKT